MKWGARKSLNSRASMDLGKGKWGRPRRPDVCGALQLPISPLWRAGHDRGSAAEAQNSQGAWAGGRAKGQRKESRAVAAPPVGLSAPPTPSKAEPAPGEAGGGEVGAVSRSP